MSTYFKPTANLVGHSADIEFLRKRFNHYENERKQTLFDQWIWGNVASYDFKLMEVKIKPCIDFLHVEFETDEPQRYSDIKKYLTQHTKKASYIRPHNQQSEMSTRFTVHLYDVINLKDLKARLDPLRHYIKDYDVNRLKVTQMELALDFYNARDDLLIALFKSVLLRENAHNIRLFGKEKKHVRFVKLSEKDKHKKQAPLLHSKFLQIIQHGGCDKGSNSNIGINDREDSIYYHGYLKQTDDGGKVLPEDQHRVRFEINFKETELHGATVGTLAKVIISRAKSFKFTKLKRHLTLKQYASYAFVKPYGLEQQEYYDSNRNKRRLSPLVESYAELNTVVKDHFKNLSNKFKK
ncbi:hypothetical protein [Acinetobacter sp. BSP-28]|uniref:hypothetical protein n=1 Tax=Acinetobacter sp. BSP-28 TaxID=3344661 RepID=UPI00376F6205